MKKLIITRGVQGSGKSYKARGFVAENPAVRACAGRDYFRIMLHGGWLGTIEQERAVTAAQKATIRALLRMDMTVVVDDTNLVSKFARAFATLAVEEGAEFEVWDFSGVPLDECLANDAKRTGPARIGEDIIRKKYEQHIRPLRGRGFPPVEPYPPVDGTAPAWLVPYEQPEPGAVPDVILVDLDGTAALMGDRGPYDWSRVGEDTVNEPVRQAVLAFAARGYDVVFMSGRDEVCRPETEKWLNEHFPELIVPVLDAPVLFMRPQGDMRKDSIVKAELFDKHVRDRWRVVAVLDDRDQVVKMWRALGLTVFQVAEGAF